MNRPDLGERFGRDGSDDVRVLAVGDVSRWRDQTSDVGDPVELAIAEFSEITPDLMRDLSPNVVVSSIFGRNFDCVDLAEKLAEIGFDGCYKVIGHGMPQPGMVLSEIRSLFPSLRVELDLVAH